LLTDLGVWDPSWVAPECGPVEYLARMGLLDERMLVVHGVRFRDVDLQRLVSRGATLVTCPRGNRLTGAGRPPVAAFFHSGVRVAVGTDSPASVPDLNLFAELAELL
jgi:cytosine/adenosine deaminase-related metal-dependent hydrolase